MTRDRRAARCCDVLQVIVQPGVDLLDRERRQSSGGQLERERNAIESDAHLGNDAGVGPGHGEGRLDGNRARDEQPHRVGLRRASPEPDEATPGARERGLARRFHR